MTPRLPTAVIDTTLLSRLQSLELHELLPWVFARVHVPATVRREVGAGPGKARRRLDKLFRSQPDFYRLCHEEDPVVVALLRVDLDAGESAVIAQADAIKGVAIIDENAGVKRAKTMSIEVIRTGRLLCDLKSAGAIRSVQPYLDRLVKLGFHLTESGRRTVLELANELEEAPTSVKKNPPQ